jgi:hypothetical protein
LRQIDKKKKLKKEIKEVLERHGEIVVAVRGEK